MLYAKFMSLSPEMENIRANLRRLRRGYFIKPGLICLSLCLLWLWLSLIAYLALGGGFWRLILGGLIFPLGYGGYKYLRCPDLEGMVALVDRQCKLEQRLVTAWQYRHSQAPVLPLLSREVIQRLTKINPATIFPLQINRRIWCIPLSLLLLTIYFWRYPLHKAVPAAFIQDQRAVALTQVANQVEQFQKQLAQFSAGGSQEAGQLKEMAEAIEKLKRIKDPAEAVRELETMKQKWANLPSAASIPPVPQSQLEQIKNAPPEKRAWLEFEVKSKHLIALLEQMEKLGLSTDQIKSQFVRELFGLLDYVIQLRSPGQANRLAQAPAKPAMPQTVQIAKGSKPVAESRLPLDASPTGHDRLANFPVVAEEDFPESFQEINLNQGWQAKQTNITPQLDNLPPAYRQRVQAMLKNQDIPLTYRQQVTAYFDAISN